MVLSPARARLAQPRIIALLGQDHLHSGTEALGDEPIHVGYEFRFEPVIYVKWKIEESDKTKSEEDDCGQRGQEKGFFPTDNSVINRGHLFFLTGYGDCSLVERFWVGIFSLLLPRQNICLMGFLNLSQPVDVLSWRRDEESSEVTEYPCLLLEIEDYAGGRAHKEHGSREGHRLFNIHVDSIARVRDCCIYLTAIPSITELEVELPGECQRSLVRDAVLHRDDCWYAPDNQLRRQACQCFVRRDFCSLTGIQNDQFQ